MIKYDDNEGKTHVIQERWLDDLSVKCIQKGSTFCTFSLMQFHTRRCYRFHASTATTT